MFMIVIITMNQSFSVIIIDKYVFNYFLFASDQTTYI